MEHKWKFGDFGTRNSDDAVVGFIKAHESTKCGYFMKSGCTQAFAYTMSAVTYRPDCTGWDWQPPKPIEPQYRPFANAAEFRPHRDRWWKRKGETVLRKTELYSEKQHGFATWEERFANYEFEDGTPFGILDDAKPSGSGTK
jgi:hypothetical protein